MKSAKSKFLTKIILCGLLFLQQFAFSQTQISNFGFESWSGNSPDSWSTLANINNALQKFCTADTFAKIQGSKALVLKTDTILFSSISQIQKYIGYASYGSFVYANSTYTVNGRPFTGRPDSVSFFTKYIPSGNDTAIFQLSLKRGGVEIGKNEMPNILNLNSDWQNIIVPITYSSALNPDTIQIDILSSKGNGNVGSTLFIDSIQFLYPAAPDNIFEIKKEEMDLHFFPNPTQQELHFFSAKFPEVDIKIQNLVGEILLETSLSTAAFLNVKNLATGIYFIQVFDKNGKHLASQKLIIE